MLQYWVSEGEFLTGGFVLLNFIELVRLCIVCFIFVLQKKEYHIGWIFRYT